MLTLAVPAAHIMPHIETMSRSASTGCWAAASTIILAAGSAATRPTPNGWCRISRRFHDNAQLIRLNWAYAASGNHLFRIRIEDTADWLLREMRVDGGAFAASLDADSDGEEGLFYTWSGQEIETALGDDSTLFFKYFTLSSPHGWEGKPVVHQTRSQQSQSVAEREKLVPLKAKLLAIREERVRPGLDAKTLTDWNGLMIAALAEAGRALARRDWIDAAAKAFAHISAASRDNRLPHSMLGARKLFPALSSAYAAMTNAAISLFEATGDWS